MQMLNGWKTYIGVAALAVLRVLWGWSGHATETIADDSAWLSWLTTDLCSVIEGLIIAWTGVSLRSAIAKNGKNK